MAGARAILSLREHGWKGAITLIGDEPYPPYDRPPLSKSAMASEAEPEPVLILAADSLSSLGVTYRAGSAVAEIARAEKAVTLSDGQRVPYHRLLLSTGAQARILPQAPHARTLRTISDARALHADLKPGRKVAIIGGGFIGLELAASASKRGCSVTVIEALPRILMRGVGATIAKIVAERHAAAGVTIITDANIERVDAGAVLLKDGRKVAADIIIAGIGALPETALAQSAGLSIDNGIACDTHMRTSDPDIFAAGDCCSFPHPLYQDRRIRLEAWRAAQDQAAVAAQNMLGATRRFEAVPWFWSDQYELTLQIAGFPSEAATTATRPLKDGAFIEFQFDADGRLLCASGIGRGNIIVRDIRLAEMLIAKRARPDPALLADPAIGLKPLVTTLAGA